MPQPHKPSPWLPCQPHRRGSTLQLGTTKPKDCTAVCTDVRTAAAAASCCLQLIQRAAQAQDGASLKTALLQHVQHDLAAAGPSIGLQVLTVSQATATSFAVSSLHKRSFKKLCFVVLCCGRVDLSLLCWDDALGARAATHMPAWQLHPPLG